LACRVTDAPDVLPRQVTGPDAGPGAGLRVVTRAASPDATAPTRVVFVHGSMDTSDSFRAVIDRLPGVHAIRYDRRGYGGSRGQGVPGSPLSGHVDDLLALLAGHRSVLVGHSLGASISLAAAARAPDLVGAVLAYEPPMPWAPWWPELPLPAGPSARAGSQPPEAALRAAAGQFMSRVMGADQWARLPVAGQERFLAAAAAWDAELRTARDAVPPPFDPQALGVAVLVGCGTCTDDRHLEAARLVVEQAPRAVFGCIPGADHRAHRRHPDEFAALVRRAVAMANGGDT
jgi:pimeloyl-ACP methyl ester carboxylesterase